MCAIPDNLKKQHTTLVRDGDAQCLPDILHSFVSQNAQLPQDMLLS